MESMLVPYNANFELPARCVLVLAPHPDDEVFGCGGALIRHVQAQCPVSVIVVSDGAFGAQGQQKNHVIGIREAESCAAAAVLGYSVPTFWRLPDRGVVYGELLVARVKDAIEASGADLVYAPALTEMHPDHRALAMVAVEAVRRLGAGVRLAMYEIGVPLVPNVLLDITAVAERKQLAMGCFRSQLAVQAYDEHISALNRFRTYTLPAHVKMAEAFRVHHGGDLSPSVLPMFECEYVRQSRLGLPMFGVIDVPLLSVVVLTWGGEGIHRALDALSLQTYENIEVVVVHAAGCASLPVGSQCGRYPMHVVGSEPGAFMPLSQAANAGLRAANGAYVAFLDDGSIVEPDHYASLMMVVKSYAPQCVIAYSGAKCMSKVGADGSGTHEWIQTSVAPHQLLFAGILSFNAPVVPRALATNGVFFDEELDLDAFQDFWLRLADRAPFKYSGRVTVTQVEQMQAATQPAPSRDPVGHQSLRFYEKWSRNLDAPKLLELSRIFLGLEKDYQAALSRLQLAESKCTRLRTDLENVQIQWNSAVKHSLAMESDAVHLRQEVVFAQEEIRVLRTSTSWRLTSPLRFIVQLWLRLKTRIAAQSGPGG